MSKMTTNMLSAFFGLGGMVMIVACPVLLVWGFWRAVIFSGVEVVVSAAENGKGASFADKQKKWGYYIMVAGVVAGPLGVFMVYLSNIIV